MEMKFIKEDSVRCVFECPSCKVIKYFPKGEYYEDYLPECSVCKCPYDLCDGSGSYEEGENDDVIKVTCLCALEKAEE
jgi:hypothetical protein